MSVPISGRIKMGHIRATIAAALAVFMLPAGVAHAQFWPQGSWWGDPFRPRHHHRHSRHTRSQPAKPESAKNAQSNEAPKGPLQIIVSIADQRVSLYDNGALVARSSVSTGTQHHPTPLGVFNVIEKQRWHRSNLYSAAPMPYMQRITWSGVALHAGVVPGHPASHGCIRLRNAFAVQLWGLTKRGTRVIVARDDVEPVAINNPHLFKPKAASGAPELQAATVGDESVQTAAAAQAPLMSHAETQEGTHLQARSSAPSELAAQKPIPISIFVSRKLSKLFVRQGFKPLFDAPVSIQNPEEPLGTHVFTAMEFENEGTAVRWTAVSMPEESPRLSGASAGARAKPVIGLNPPAPSPDRANTALDRIDIPQDVAERISGLLTPASSLVVSDQGLGRETGRGTDFIVVTH